MAHQLPIDRMSFGDRLAYAFRERQIYVRSEGQVRFITLRPWIQITFVLIVVGIFGWIAYASLNVAFKDYVIAAKKRQFANVQTVYEDRITSMLSSMDQLNGRLLLNQDTVEARLEGVRDIQGALELRQRQIAALMARQFGVAMSELVPAAVDGPQLIQEDDRSRVLITFEPANTDLRNSRVPGEQTNLEQSDGEVIQAVRRIGHRLRALANAQAAALGLMETRTATRQTDLAQTLASLGFDAKRFAPAPSAGHAAALGGPLIRLGAFDPQAPASIEERQMVRISNQMAAILAYTGALEAMPLRRPLRGTVRISSGFGARRDPFTGTNAMHQGIDYPGPSGTPVLATAAGKVKRASWSGAYGRMVEIVHDNGLSTRYAHLSKIEVNDGDAVTAGQRVGLVGSTGRSTGSHVHYETRVNGAAVNPVRFLRAGVHVLQ
jgi:hypothetical protein